jgi:hypothetical protein
MNGASIENPGLRELDAQLANEGEAVPVAEGGEGAPAAPPALPNRDAIRFGLETFRTLVCLLLKVESPKETLGDEQVRQIAEAVAPVADKYGVNLAGVFGAYAQEIAAIAVTAPILWGAWKALDAELRTKREARPKGADDTEQAGRAGALPQGDPVVPPLASDGTGEGAGGSGAGAGTVFGAA